ncbi:small-subunit processome [Dipodascopsis tothii]|uniref:small-subunit processome n=1 Tax=Dipodascopsis tothii TaxID=44089 RepID=UPI0034D011F9
MARLRKRAAEEPIEDEEIPSDGVEEVSGGAESGSEQEQRSDTEASSASVNGSGDELEDDSDEGSDGDSEGESEDVSDDDADSALEISDDDVEDDEALDSLHNLVSSMSKSKRTAGGEAAEKRKRMKLDMGSMHESASAVPVSGKVSLADMLSSVSSAQLRSSVDELKTIQEKKKVQVVKGRQGRRIEKRIDRQAAYEISKEEVSKWKDTVKANREAEHLVFPINPEPTLSKPTVVGEIEPSTALEKDIKSILDESKLNDEKGLSAFEETAMRKMSIEEFEARKRELRQARDLMFREEQKAKRIKKIKSKTYRRIHKKEREREQAMLDEMNGEDGEDDQDRQIARAKERMSLKHKNASKWAKNMKVMNLNKDQLNREELEEMYRRGQELTRRIEGDSESSGDELIESDGDAEADDAKSKGIMGMKFMQDANERERKRNAAAREELRKLQDGNESEETAEVDESSVMRVVNEGRRVYGPGAQEAKKALNEVLRAQAAENDDEEPSSLGKKLGKAGLAVEDKTDKPGKAKKASKASKDGKADKTAKPASTDEAANPWLDDDATLSRAGAMQVLSKDSTKTAKAEAKLKRRKNKDRAAAAAAADDVTIDMNDVLKIRVEESGDESDGEDNEVGVTLMPATGRSKAGKFAQRDLVRRAFAGDDVVVDFEAEKKQTIAEEGDQEIDETLPGWGSWTGKGLHGPKKKFIRKVEGVKANKRQDARLKNVIINERSNKKAAKYQADKVNFPYESREQYERALRMPIGREWSSQDTFQKLTKPRVIVKRGMVVDPIEAPFKT